MFSSSLPTELSCIKNYIITLSFTILTREMNILLSVLPILKDFYEG